MLNVSDDESVQAAIKDFRRMKAVLDSCQQCRHHQGQPAHADEAGRVGRRDRDKSYGTLSVSKACLRGMMKAKKGRIINIASVIAVMGNAGQANYAATKAGMIGFSKSLAREIGSRGITVNVVAPGFIDTDMTKVLPEEQRAAMLAQVPLGRLGEGDDIANAVLFLASGAGAYITGETLHVNGGMVMD